MTAGTILRATVVAGTLDILSAFVFAGTVVPVLRTVASGPFGAAVAEGPAGAPLGLLTHFAIMAVMATVYVVTAQRVPALRRHWLAAGLLYGAALWLVMYWIVLPLRWESYQMPHELVPIVKQLFSHSICTGLPIAWIAARAAVRPSSD
jgi:hypothetical protein